MPDRPEHSSDLSNWDRSSPARQQDITTIDHPMKSAAFSVLILIAVLDPLIIITVLAFAGLSWWIVALSGVAAVVLPLFVMWLISTVAWNPVARRYPAQPILAGAVSKSWQSFSIGTFNRYNNCITIIADEKHLHLVPFALLKIGGAKTFSLPLDRMIDVKPAQSLLMPGMMRGTLDGRTIIGPNWCMRLAAPPEPADAMPTKTAG